MKILVLEDEIEAAIDLKRALSAAGHVVDLCGDGSDAEHLASGGRYQILVVDRMVPGKDGLQAVKSLRAAGVLTPVIFLTAVGGVGDRVEGLEAGGDDYLVKPFAFTELLARINALGRRSSANEVRTVFRAGDLELDMLTRAVTRAGRRIELKPQEYKLLEYLMRHIGQVVTRAMLLEHVWSFHFDPRTNIVESHMSRVRSKVDRGFGREVIHTVRGAGYRIDAAP